jgi:hypothetical protein
MALRWYEKKFLEALTRRSFLEEFCRRLGPQAKPRELFDANEMIKPEFEREFRERFQLSDDRSHFAQVREQCFGKSNSDGDE